MSRSRTGVAGPPFCCSAKVAMHDQAVVLRCLFDLDLLALDKITIATRRDPGSWHTKMGQFTNGHRCFVGEYSGNLLVSAPVRAAHRVEIM